MERKPDRVGFGTDMMRRGLAGFICFVLLAVAAWPVVANASPAGAPASAGHAASTQDPANPHGTPGHRQAGHCTASICWSPAVAAVRIVPALSATNFRWHPPARVRRSSPALDRDPPVPRRMA